MPPPCDDARTANTSTSGFDVPTARAKVLMPQRLSRTHPRAPSHVSRRAMNNRRTVALRAVASAMRRSQIVEVVGATSVEGNNVIDLESKWLEVMRAVVNFLAAQVAGRFTSSHKLTVPIAYSRRATRNPHEFPR